MLQDGVRRRDGRELALRLVIPTETSGAKQIAELVQGMLGRLGVTVAINPLPTADFFDKYIIPGNFDLTVFAWLGTPFPISSARPIYTTPKTGPGGQLDIQRNYARVGSHQLDQTFERATAELDPAKAIQMGNQIDAMIWQEVHSLTFYQRPDIVAARSSLVNFGAFGFASAIYEDIGFANN